MNIWNDGDHFNDKSIDYAIWTDKLTIRKGNKGWQITELVNSLAGAVKYIQVTTYKNDQGEWKPTGQPLIGSIGRTNKSNRYTISCATEDNQIGSSRAEKENKFLKFWVNGVAWYLGNEVSKPTATDTSNEKNAEEGDLSEVFRESKSGSWIWFEDANKQKGLLENFGSLQYSKDDKESYRLTNCYNLFFGNDKELKMNSATNIMGLYFEIEKEWKSKGQWINTEEVCGLANKRKWSVNEDQRKNLKLFCTKPKD